MIAPSTHMALLSTLSSLLGLAFVWDQTGTRFALDALLLLEFPLLLTFTAFVELPPFAEAVHQLQRLQDTAIILVFHYFFLSPLFITRSLFL
jgi:hypothetical protein